jgi:hypothetical protein
MSLRLGGMIVGGAVAAACGVVLGAASAGQPGWGLAPHAGVAGALTGALLGPALRAADRVRIVAVGSLAGLVGLMVGGLLSALAGLAESVGAGRVGLEGIPAVIAGLIVSPLLVGLFGAPLLLVLVPVGIGWAATTVRVASEPRGTRDIGQR